MKERKDGQTLSAMDQEPAKAGQDTENSHAKRWFYTFLGLQLGTLFFIILVMVVVDPYFHYHKPLSLISYRLYEERYINDGISRHFDYNAMITGSSMTQNFKTSEFDRLFGTKSVKEPFSGAGFEELSQNLDRALTYNKDLKTVLMCLDYNGLNREHDWKQYEDYPEYLYDDNLFNDVSYVLNKSILYRGCFNNLFLTLTGEESTTFDEYSAWGSAYGFSHIMQSYERKVEKVPMAEGLTEEEKERVMENMEKNIVPLLEKYPDTTFYFFYPPYSILYWDLLEKDGMIKSQLEAEEMVTDLLLSYDNVRLFSFFENTDLICNLDNYRDKEHYISDINSYLLEQMSRGGYEITAENQEEHMDFMRRFYLHFDYGAFVKEQSEEKD